MSNSVRRVRVVAVVFGVVVGALVAYAGLMRGGTAGDMSIPLCGARALLTGVEPYSVCQPPKGLPQNPVTTMLVLLPLAWLPAWLVPALLLGAASGGLAWAWRAEPWRLLVFLSLPGLAALRYGQWAPVMLAAVVYPALYAITIAKPQLGIPIAALRFQWRGALVAAVLVLVSFAWYGGNWIPPWLATTANYTGSSAMLRSPALIVVLATCWLTGVDRERFLWLLLFSLFPLRAYYDFMILVLAIPDRRTMIAFVAVSWVPVAVEAANVFGGASLDIADYVTLPFFVVGLGLLLHGRALRYPLRGKVAADQ